MEPRHAEPGAERGWTDRLTQFVAELPSERRVVAEFLTDCSAALEPGARVLGVGDGFEPYAELFGHCLLRRPEGGPGAEAPLVSGGTASFDAVVCVAGLERITDPARLARDLATALREGGRLILHVAHAWPADHAAPDDYLRFSAAGVTRLLEEAGFGALELRRQTDGISTIGFIASAERVADTVDLPAGPAPTGPVPVLYLAPWVDLGGSDKGTIDWFKHIDHTQWSPSLITTQPSSNRWVTALEPYADEVWTLPELMGGQDFPKFVLDFIVSRGVRVVHIMNSRLAFDLLPDISALEDPPVVVVQLHAEEPDRSGYVRYTSMRYANLIDAFSVTSEQLGAAVRGYGVPASKVHVITTGVDCVDEFNPELIEPLEGLAGTAPRILWPGRLVAQKDPMLTLDVVRLLADRGVDFVLDVVGDGDMAIEVRARARELGVDDRICWYPPSKEMPRWYRSSDLLLMTSVFEGVPYVMYESIAMGVPVVVPAIPGNVEFLPDEQAGGILIEPRDDATAYADAIERLLRNPQERLELGRLGRERLMRDFTLEEMGERHGELYRSLLDARPAAIAPAEPEPLEPITLPRTAPIERSVAVIVPCYRHGQFLEDAIASIKRQTLPAAEIVVVDDASPDPETIEALDRVEQDPEVRVIRLARNGGPSIARNRALAEVSANYVLPLDADDLLLPDALERMVEQLEVAPQDVGFVYPNALHFGNRHDYWEVPAYNLFMLMQDNFCPATTLFDRRIFEAGIRYPEQLVRGHEDWDLVLQLGARGVHGIPADGPTFLYRKAGFSRITSVEYASAEEKVHDRHPELYARVEAIKAAWAPALSIVLPDRPADDDWPALVEALRAQTCQDFDLWLPGPLPADVPDWLAVRTVEIPAGAADARARMCAQAVDEASGRFFLILDPAGLELLQRTSAVETVIRAFWANPALLHYGVVPSPERVPFFTQLDEHAIGDAEAVAVAWRREEGLEMAPIDIGDGESALIDIVTHWEMDGPVQWRSA